MIGPFYLPYAFSPLPLLPRTVFKLEQVWSGFLPFTSWYAMAPSLYFSYRFFCPRQMGETSISTSVPFTSQRGEDCTNAVSHSPLEFYMADISCTYMWKSGYSSVSAPVDQIQQCLNLYDVTLLFYSIYAAAISAFHVEFDGSLLFSSLELEICLVTLHGAFRWY